MREEMAALNLDCRGRPVPETGAAILDAFNALADGGELVVRCDQFGAGLKMWLIEAGAKHEARRTGGGDWRVEIRRGASPGQGTIPGLHHLVVGDGDRIWAAERARRVGEFDGGSGELVSMRAVADKASHMALDPAGAWLFVADSGANTMLCLDSGDLAVRHGWPAPGLPQLPLVTADGIVCVTGAATGTLTIAWPAAGGFRVRSLEVGACPHDPVASKDGRTLFVPCAGDGEIAKVDLADGRVTGRFRSGGGASHLALHPGGGTIYSANSFDGTVSAISVDGDDLGSAPSGGWAHVPKVTPDGRFVYVANFLDDTLAVFDAASLDRIAVLETEAYPHGLDISPDGRYVVATGFGSDFIRVYDAASHTETARIEVGRGSSHTVFTDGGRTAYVACSVADHLARIDLEAGELTGKLFLP